MRAVLALALIALGCTRGAAEGAPDAHAGPTVLANAVPGIATAAAAERAPAPPAPRFVGRWVPEPGGAGMRAAWSGVHVVGRFRGTRISARLRDEGTNLFQVVIDGEPKKVLRTDRARGDALYELADGLADGPHDVELHKRTEARAGEVVFHAFEAATADGREAPLLPPGEAPRRRIELVGDSITTGYGNEGPGAACSYATPEQNAYATYGAIAARKLGADHVLTAWSGKTLHEMTEAFGKVLPARSDGPAWDFARSTPDAVVLNLGTNDFANVDPGERRFVAQWLDLVHEVRAAYPRALLVVALGPMLSDVYPPKRRSLTQARKYTKVALQKLAAEGEKNLAFLEFPEQNHADGLGCGYHPSLKTHQLMADRLAAFLQERLGW